jgi:hypothetical protein
VRAFAAVATDSYDPAALRIGQLDEQDMGPVLENMEARHVRNGKTLLTAAPSTRAIGPNESPA